MATDSDYIQLVSSSETFKKLDKVLQGQILAAEGDDREYFRQTFSMEKEGIDKAQDDLANTTSAAIASFELEANRAKKDVLKSAEDSTQRKDDEQAEKLIKSI